MSDLKFEVADKKPKTEVYFITDESGKKLGEIRWGSSKRYSVYTKCLSGAIFEEQEVEWTPGRVNAIAEFLGRLNMGRG